MPTYIAGQSFRLEDANVRPGSSPSDLMIAYIPDVVLSSSAGTVDLAQYIGHAEVVSYIMLKQVTSSYSSGTNTIAIAAAVPGAAVTVDVLVFYRATKAQG